MPFVIEIALEPLSPKATERLLAARELAPEGLGDFDIAFDRESGQAILRAYSQQQLSLIVNWLRRQLDLLLNVGVPQVAYRETLGRGAEVSYVYKKQTGGYGQFAKVTMLFEPLPPWGGELFESRIPKGAVPDRIIPAIEKGVRSVADSGIISGFPVIDFKATLIDGAYHDIDSTEVTFEIAARAAFREAAKITEPKLLEPIMQVEVTAPNEFAAPILRDLRARRTGETITRKEGADAIIVAETPLSNLFGYDDALALITDGRGRCTTALARYTPIPNSPPPDDDYFGPAVCKRA